MNQKGSFNRKQVARINQLQAVNDKWVYKQEEKESAPLRQAVLVKLARETNSAALVEDKTSSTKKVNDSS